jgi:hypothetical protein
MKSEAIARPQAKSEAIAKPKMKRDAVATADKRPS